MTILFAVIVTAWQYVIEAGSLIGAIFSEAKPFLFTVYLSASGSNARKLFMAVIYGFSS
jgi:hypothetical protein